ncbi:helix-turn-helix domain-containing protein [Flavobacteriaceae bacterium M23B6Z8]
MQLKMMMWVSRNAVFWSVTSMMVATLSSFQGQAQKGISDSLDTMSFEQLYQGYQENKNKKEVAKQYARAFLEKGRLESDLDLESYGLFYMADTSDDEIKVAYLDSVISLTKDASLEYDTFPELAYISLADYYYKQRSFDKALPVLLKGLESAERNNKTYEIHRINYFIALIKSERLEKVREALDIVQKSFNFFSAPANKTKYTRQYLESIYALGDIHRKLKQSDSASFYNTLGKREAMKSNEEELSMYFTFSEGLNKFYQDSYQASIDSLMISLGTIKTKQDIANLSLSYNYLGRSYLKKGETEKGITYLKLTDSIFRNTGVFNIEMRPGFEALINYYSDSNNMEKQLEQVQNLLEIDNRYNTQYKDIRNLMEVAYNKRNLLEEKDQLLTSLAQTRKKSEIWKYLIVIVALILGSLSLFYFFQQRKYRIRFEEILENNGKVSNLSLVDSLDEDLPSKDNDIGVPENIVDIILQNLEKFERKQQYLNPKMNSYLLAEKTNTNTKYLSKVINEYKKKSIINYLNDLRIEFAINKLKNDPKFRIYTIKAIAEEVGFNNPTSFSSAFRRYTQLNPSYFIKRINTN